MLLTLFENYRKESGTEIDSVEIFILLDETSHDKPTIQITCGHHFYAVLTKDTKILVHLDITQQEIDMFDEDENIDDCIWSAMPPCFILEF